MKSNEISAVVPVFNTPIARFKSCISSILDNSSITELIIVDDGSNRQLSLEYEKISSNNQQCVFIRKQNEGVAASRNLGISKATGDYVIMIDSDDYISDDYAEKLLNCAKRTKAEFIFPKIEIRNGQKISIISLNEGSYKMPEDFDLFINQNYRFTFAGALISKKLLDKQKFDKNLSYGEDIEFTMRVLNNNTFAQDINATYYYIQEGESAIQTKNKTKINKYFNDSIKALELIAKEYENSKTYQIIYSKICNYIERLLKTDMSKREMTTAIKKALADTKDMRRKSGMPKIPKRAIRKMIIDTENIALITNMIKIGK